MGKNRFAVTWGHAFSSATPRVVAHRSADTVVENADLVAIGCILSSSFDVPSEQLSSELQREVAAPACAFCFYSSPDRFVEGYRLPGKLNLLATGSVLASEMQAPETRPPYVPSALCLRKNVCPPVNLRPNRSFQ